MPLDLPPPPPPPGFPGAPANGGPEPGGIIKLTRKDFQTSNDVRWCPGCGDYAILATVQRFLPEVGVPKEKTVFISGIGCAARFPYYMETYGMHTVHGRAPSIATGLKLVNPELDVWVISGDGDALSIGGNHMLHVLRRNVGLKILLFNNRIYGLTKGQYSPASEQGKVTKSTPTGSLDYPVNPATFALGAGATFFARTLDRDAKHMMDVLAKAVAHKGTVLVEILQNCVVFNDGAWDALTDKTQRNVTTLVLEDGKPMVFDDGKKGIAIDRAHLRPIIVDLVAEPARIADVLVHDEKDPSGIVSYMLAKMEYPAFPVPVGVFRRVDRPVYDEQVTQQGADAKKKRGAPDLKALLYSGDVWTVEA
jgi:2-oxoglutarate ferredoxin oxidoreductase subunit beta